MSKFAGHIFGKALEYVHTRVPQIGKLFSATMTRVRHHQSTIRSVTFGAAFVATAAVGAFIAWAMVVSVPAVEGFQYRKVAESTKIYDRTGDVLLFDVHGTMRRTAVPLNDIAPNIRNATIAIEDAEFYQHIGFRPLSFMRAVLANITTGSYGQGGSTITQQVVKNTLLTQDKTIIRKLKEIVLALKLERAISKDRILEIYLNETSYGGTLYGIEEASQAFYGKSAKDVDLAEAAYLAALPQAPTRYSPYGNHRNELENRKNLVLSRMKDLGFITEEQYTQAKAETVTFVDASENGIKAPHFVFYIREYLEEKYGPDTVSNGGLQVVTTLDYDLQKHAEEIVKRKALENKVNFNAENAGLVAIDPQTGQILTMVGSRGYFDDEIDGKVNVALTHRQPGSSFKPFVYAAAFEKGYTPDTILFDLQTQFAAACSPGDLSTHDTCYAPGNYDDKFRGPMTLRDALAQSINVVAVKLLYLVGIDNALSMAKRLGITTLGDRNQYGLTLVLGGGEVSLLEMVSAYATFADEGIKRPAVSVLEVRDASGNVLEKYEEKGDRVLEVNIARTVSDILSDNVARTPEFGADSALYFSGYHVADKTGTTNDYRDAWIIGYTPSLAAGAWAGNNNNAPMEKKIAGFIIAPLWHEFMAYAFTRYPPQNFTAPDPEPNSELIPPVLRGQWNTDPSRGVHEILYWVDKKNPRLPATQNATQDSQFNNWEYPVALWAHQNPMLPTSGTGPAVITEFAIATPGQKPLISGAPSVAQVEYLSSFPITQVSYYLDTEFLGSTTNTPFEFTFTPQKKGTAIFRAVAEGPLGKRESSVTVTIQ